MSAAVIAFDQAKRQDQVTKSKRVQEAMSAFVGLIDDHGCDFVLLHGRTPDGRHFRACSGKMTIYDPDGVNIDPPGTKGGAA